MTRLATLSPLLILALAACGSTFDLGRDTASLAFVADAQGVTAIASFPDADHSLLGSGPLPAGDTLTACCGATCVPMTERWGLFGETYAAELGAVAGACAITWTRGATTAAAHATLPPAFDLTSPQAATDVPASGAITLAWTDPTGTTVTWSFERSCGNEYSFIAGDTVPDTGVLTIPVARLLEEAPASTACGCTVTLTRAVAGAVDPGFAGFGGSLEARQERMIAFQIAQ
ncbi:MAG TPA: hypothetical protein VGQ83_31640 [Polyangia bacterium]